MVKWKYRTEVERKDGTNENTGSESFNVTIVTIDKWESTLGVSNDAIDTIVTIEKSGIF